MSSHSGLYEISAFFPIYVTTCYGLQGGQVLRKPVLPIGISVNRLARNYILVLNSARVIHGFIMLGALLPCGEHDKAVGNTSHLGLILRPLCDRVFLTLKQPKLFEQFYSPLP